MKTAKFIIIFAIVLYASCLGANNQGLEKAKLYSNQSIDFYQKAILEYKQVLSAAKDKDSLRLELGNLYYQHGDYDKAIEVLAGVNSTEAKKLLAYSFYKSNNFTDALAIFNKLGELSDDEYLYYYALTSERLNLFDQAKKFYLKIKGSEYNPLATARIKSIDSLSQASTIQKLDPAIYKIIKEAPGQEKYPQASALILLSDEKMDILPDNTSVFERHFLVKILNDRGKSFGEIEIGYDSTDEKVELDFARTIKPDGEVIKVGDKHIRDVSKYLNFPLYSNARAMIISMPEVAVGSIIEYKVKIYQSRLVNKKDFYTAYTVQESEPIIQEKFTLSFPEERKASLLMLNEEYNYFKAKLAPRISEKDGKKIYSWEFRNIPEIIPEPNMPPASETVTSFLLSSFSSWDEIYKWWWDLAKDKILASSDIKQKVSQLVKDKAADRQKAEAIYDWCIQNIRYVAVEYGEAGHEPHKAEDIFRNKYGDCKDQSVLLITMLKEAGLDAFPVLIGTKGVFKLDDKFPSLFFNHAIVALKINNEVIFLDPTAETVTFGDLPNDDQDRKVFVFFKEGGKILKTPLMSANQNRTESKTKITIKKDESIEARREVATYGLFNSVQRYWLKYTMPILIEETLREKANSFSPGAELIDYKIDNPEDQQKPVKLIYNFKGPEYLTKAGQARIIPNLGSVDLSYVSKEKRTYPVDLGMLSERVDIAEFGLPSNFKIRFMPESKIRDSKWLSFVDQYEAKDGRIIFTQKSIIKTTQISKEDYLAFKKFLEGLSREINQCIVLEKVDGQ